MPVDKNSIIPLYYQIKDDILKDIRNGKYKPDEKLPGELQLAKKFNVSRPTVRQALNELVFEKVLYREHGKGTYISKPKIKSNLEILTPFVEETGAQGYTPGIRVISKKVILATESIAKALDIPVGSKIIEFVRIRLVDNEPVILKTSYFSYELLSQLLKDESIEPLYPRIESYGFHLVRASQSLQVVQAREYESNLLNISLEHPLVMWEGIVYSQYDKPIEYVKSFYKSDRYNFHIEQYRDIPK